MKSQSEAEYIYSLISQGEHVEQDFKYEISDARKIARTLSAFANTQGGRLLIGVKDNGRIAGVRSDEESYMIEAAAQLYCRPQLDVTMRTYHVEGRTILLAHIDEASDKPVMALDEKNKAWAYVRVADENILASPIHLQVWRTAGKKQPEIVSFTQREHQVLELLMQQEECTLPHVCKAVGLSRHTAQTILARFIHWGVVAMRYNGHTFVYSAADITP